MHTFLRTTPRLRSFSLSLIVLAAAASLSISNAQAANTPGSYVSTILGARDQGGNAQFFSDAYNGGRTFGLNSYDQTVSGNVSVYLHAQAGAGYVSTSGGFFFDAGSARRATIQVYAGFQDTLTIDGGARNGQQGTLTGSVSVGFTQAMSSPIQYNIFHLGISQAADGSSNYGEWGFEGEGHDFNQTIPFTIGFTFGQPFDFGIQSYTLMETLSVYGTGINGFQNLGRANWNGISAIKDNAGNTLTTSTLGITSGSGTNYTVAIVPEPASAGLLLGASLALAGFRRRRPAA